MQISPCASSVADLSADAVVVGVWADGSLTSGAAALDKATQGALKRLIAAKEISGKRYDIITLFAPAGIQALSALVIGLGDKADLDRGSVFKIAATAAKALGGKPRAKVGFFLLDDWTSELLESAIGGAIVGCVGQDLYKSQKRLQPFGELLFAGATVEAIELGKIIGESVNLTRHLVNEPPSEIYPVAFADRAEQIAKSVGLECEIWDKAKLTEQRCGSLLAVARGSDNDPRMVILKHAGGAADAPWLALVGKGVTFDSGGLSIKPTDGMLTMKCDMAGAATVVGAMQAIAQLKLPVNVIGLCGLVENMLGGDAYKLGDVLHARSGKTIEVHNTDAEGRLVLADVLDVAVERGADHIIDLATLTGACVVALGLDVAGLMTNQQAWCDKISAAANSVGEQVWQLPMFAEFGEQIKGDVADIKNVGSGRWGGAITAAKFLEEFVAGKPWTHMDIAGPSFLDRPKPYLDAGGSGAYVRTLVEIARQWNK
ncbi:MAG TPA: leucyl aminopeptidase [Pirellulaceae bacterium]|nr:leucyl aminopeptidase [Pirellulaceae bacterium]